MHRETEISDAVLLEQLLANDPIHKDVPAQFFIEKTEDGTKGLGVKCLTIENEKGPIFFLRFENVMRVYLQMNADQDPEEVKTAFKETLVLVHTNGRKLGYKALIFDSVYKPLIRFFKALGFHKFDDVYKLDF
jgi:hypothetical protein